MFLSFTLLYWLTCLTLTSETRQFDGPKVKIEEVNDTLFLLKYFEVHEDNKVDNLTTYYRGQSIYTILTILGIRDLD